MTLRRLALFLCLLLTVTALPTTLPAPAAPAHAIPARASAPSATKMPCCCRPGHCHMAMCHGDPAYARTHAGAVSCVSCACGPAPRPAALLPDGGHRRNTPAGTRSALLPPRGLPISYTPAQTDALRVRPALPHELPPRAR